MKRHTDALRLCLVLLVSAGAWGSAFGQSDGGVSRAGADMNAAVVREGAPAEPLHPRDTQWTPIPPAPVPFGTALREHLDAVRDRLQAAVAKREAAVQHGKTGEEIKALDAGIEELRRQAAAVQSEMDLGGVPAQPVTPRPHSRAASSTNP
jgi:hypothetical protein